MSGSRYTIGVDFGTESGARLLVDCRRRRRDRHRGVPVRERRDRRPPAGARRRRRARARTGRSRTRRLSATHSVRRFPLCSWRPAIDPADRSSGSASTSPRARCSRRSPTARRSANCPELPARATCVGEALEAPRRPARGRPDQPTVGRSAASRGSPATAARSRPSGSSRRRSRSSRGACDLDRGRPADRSRRLGRLAAHRRRDAIDLHGRLQGDVVESSDGFPSQDYFAALDPAVRRRRRRRRCRRDLAPLGTEPAA